MSCLCDPEAVMDASSSSTGRTEEGRDTSIRLGPDIGKTSVVLALSICLALLQQAPPDAQPMKLFRFEMIVYHKFLF